MQLTIDGDSDVSLLPEGVCSHKAGSDGGVLLSWVQRGARGTLRRARSAGSPKGVRGSTAYVTRINSAGQWRMAKPCDRCLDQLKRAGIKYVVFTTDDGTWMRGKL